MCSTWTRRFTIGTSRAKGATMLAGYFCSIEPQQHVVALAVLLDPVGQAAQAPVFALLDGAALGLQLGGDVVGDLLDLLLRDVIPCDQHGFI